MKVVLAQLNPTIGDFASNGEQMAKAMEAAHQGGAKLIVFPELATCGYPPRDLVEEAGFIDLNLKLLESLKQHGAKKTPGLTVLLGYPRRTEAGASKAVANAAVAFCDGRVVATVDKSLLPTYDVFDENRYFAPGKGTPTILNIDGISFGITICEDLWNVQGDSCAAPADFASLASYPIDIAKRLQEAGAEVLLNLSASPFWNDKIAFREKLFAHLAKRHQVAVLMVNQVGANDDLIFDGSSLALDAAGEVKVRGKRFSTDLVWVEVRRSKDPNRDKIEVLPVAQSKATTANNALTKDDTTLLFALTMGIRDYFSKSGFQQAVLGLSGGIDSALVAALAVRALGHEKVVGVMMPSRFTSPQSLQDAQAVAKALKIGYQEISIEPLFKVYLEQLQPLFGERAWDSTEENLQARIRGALLMAYSNKFGHLLLTTGNKSELAVGYCTLYGDLTGGLAVISDLFKTQVYQLCATLNRLALADGGAPLIPQSIIDRAPSAELRANQTDQQSLPPYEQLDAILRLYIEESQDAGSIVKKLGDEATVLKVLKLVDGNEFKRRQMALGLKVSKRAFGQGRRLPIVQRRSSPRSHYS